MKEYFEDDRNLIPDDIKEMTRKQRKQEIARLEEEAKRNKTENQKIRLIV